MKRYVSDDDDNYYTYMLKILNAIGGRKLQYNWLITDIEAYPQDNANFCELVGNNGFLFFTNDELISMLEKDDFQWCFAVFSAIPKKYSKEDILKYELPFTDGNYDIYRDNMFIIQHPLADIEIVAFDSSSVHIVAKDDMIADKFKKVFKSSRINY